MSQAPSMPVFTDALLGDTLHLSAEEFGAYCLLLFATWRNNGVALADDDRKMARICRVTVRRWQQRLRPVLIQFFQTDDHLWHQKRLEKEWQFVADFSAVQRSKGLLSGKARRLRSLQTQGTGVPPGFKPETNPHTHTHKEEDTDAIASVARARQPGDFAGWWSEWPHKVGKPAAVRAYRGALARASPADLLTGARRYAATKPPDRSWLNPATFLNQDRWLDEPASTAGAINGHRPSPAEKLFAGFAAAAGFDIIPDSAADEPLLDGGRPAGDTPGAGRGLDRRPGRARS